MVERTFKGAVCIVIHVNMSPYKPVDYRGKVDVKVASINSNINNSINKTMIEVPLLQSTVTDFVSRSIITLTDL